MISDKMKKEIEERIAVMQENKKDAIEKFIKIHGHEE